VISIFSKRWRHPDWRVREQAAMQLRDEAKLLFLAMNDVAEEVRVAAVKGLPSDEARKRVVIEAGCSRSRRMAFSMISQSQILIEILKHPKVPEDLRLMVIERVEPTVEILLDLFRSEESASIRQIVLKKLPPCRELDQCYVSTDPLDLRLMLIPKLCDPDLIRQVAMQDTAHEVRAAAIARIEDRESLARIFREETVPEVRLVAAKQMPEEPVLQELLEEEDNETVRCGICSLLKSEAILNDVARNDYNPEVRLAAIRKLKSPKNLMTVIHEEPDRRLRVEALSRISDESKLATFACSAKDDMIRHQAVAGLRSKEMLQNVIANSMFGDSRWIASRRLGDGQIEDLLSITNSRVLASVVAEERDADLRAFAIRGMSDEVLLQKLAEGEDDADAAAARMVLAWRKGFATIRFAPIPGRPYEVSAFPITIGEYASVNGYLPDRFQECDADLPVTGLSPAEAHAFCEKLSAIEGRRCRLPSFDEWEHSILAGEDVDSFSQRWMKMKAKSFLPSPVHLQGAGPRQRRKAWPNSWESSIASVILSFGSTI
jgi:hypothetical protein